LRGVFPSKIVLFA